MILNILSIISSIGSETQLSFVERVSTERQSLIGKPPPTSRSGTFTISQTSLLVAFMPTQLEE